jgi:hypothetical protein
MERCGHLRGETGVAIGVAVDQMADARALRRLRQRAQRRPAFEARSFRVDENWVEVIEVPQ